MEKLPKNILLLSVPVIKTKETQTPVSVNGLLPLGSYLADKGLNVRILDMTNEYKLTIDTQEELGKYHSTVIDRINSLDKRPDVIGISAYSSFTIRQSSVAIDIFSKCA